MNPDHGSITGWYQALAAGDRAAATPLFHRYFERMLRLARGTLRTGARNTAEADEEDAALSAFESFCAGAERGRFTNLDDREDLWRLLAVITVRKARGQARRQRRLKRGGGRVFRVSDAPAAGPPEDALNDLAAPGPGPDLVALGKDELARLLDVLQDEALRRVAILRMEGHLVDEIAAELGCARRTIARQLDLIRKIWISGEDAERSLD